MIKPSTFLTAGFASLLLAALTLSPPPLIAGVTSSTSIEAGKTFVLGGEQRRTLSVDARNDGDVAVEILLAANGSERKIARIVPGASTRLKVPAGNAALFRNASSRTATVYLKLGLGANGLSMRYTDH
jgi:hypothetical protein